jgi:hypothetical protein
VKTNQPFHTLENQQLALRYVHAMKGLGRDEKEMESVLTLVGKNKHQAGLNSALKSLGYKEDALTLARQEIQSNPLEKVVMHTRMQRFEDLYQQGKEQYRGAGWQYRLEGLSKIPMELFQAFKQHPVVCGSVFAGIAIGASFVPYAAALLSAGITAMSLVGVVRHELAATKQPKNSEKRAEHLIQAGENWAGVLINLLPLPEVVKHLEEGRNHIRAAYAGKTAKHALEEPTHLQSIPRFFKVNAQKVTDLTKAIVTEPLRIEPWNRGLKAAVSYESNLPEVTAQFKTAAQSGSPSAMLGAVKHAVLGQVPLALTLIDEVMFPFVKAIQSIQNRKEG